MWEGVGHQNDGQTWPLVVTVRAAEPGRCASVDYPSIPCKAIWICTEIAEDGSLLGREELTEGIDRCIDNGTLSMRFTPEGRMDWTWQRGDVTARSTLDRKP